MRICTNTITLHFSCTNRLLGHTPRSLQVNQNYVLARQPNLFYEVLFYQKNDWLFIVFCFPLLLHSWILHFTSSKLCWILNTLSRGGDRHLTLYRDQKCGKCSKIVESDMIHTWIQFASTLLTRVWLWHSNVETIFTMGIINLCSHEASSDVQCSEMLTFS